MTLGKTIIIRCPDEITKTQMKEISNGKKVNGIRKKKLWKASKQNTVSKRTRSSC